MRSVVIHFCGKKQRRPNWHPRIDRIEKGEGVPTPLPSTRQPAIFVIGTERSGTSLFRLKLNTHALVARVVRALAAGKAYTPHQNGYAALELQL